MATEGYLLGIDVGTSSIKTVLTNATFQVCASAEMHYEVHSTHGGLWVELDAEAIWNSLLSCLQKMGTRMDLSCICGIGIDCLCPSLIAMDINFHPLQNPILYSDRRSLIQAEQLQQLIGFDELFSITANAMTAGATSVSSMHWFRQTHPELYRKTCWFGHINTFLLARMSGEVAIDPTNASYTGLFDTVHTQNWSPRLCRTFDVSQQMLPPVRKSSEICGRLCNKDLLELRIPSNTPIVIGAADTASAALACGILHAGQAFESSGTTDVLSICVDKPVFSPLLVNRCHAVDGRWLYQCVHSSSAAALRWGMQASGFSAADVSYERFTEFASRQPAGAGGACFLPFVGGERCGVWRNLTSGSLTGISSELSPGMLARSVVEGCCYALRQLKDIAEDAASQHFDTLVLVGGGSQNLSLVQMKADILDCQFEIQKIHHVAPVGATMLAAVGIGWYASVEQASRNRSAEISQIISPRATSEERKIYTERYHRFLCLCHSFGQLS